MASPLWLRPAAKPDKQQAPVKARKEIGSRTDETYQPIPDPYAEENARFGHDLAFLDPIFQQEVELLGESAASQAQADPRAIEAQRQALDLIMGIATGGGATALERARMARTRADQEGWLRGQREADMQNLAERGMSGSGAELANLAMDRQAAAQRMSAADLETEAMLEQRVLDAIMAGGQMAGQMRGASFSEDFDRRGAQDTFSQLNQSAINAVNSANKNYLREAQRHTLDNRQNWGLTTLGMGLNAAQNLLASDIGQDQFGYGYAGGIAGQDVAGHNTTRTHVGTLGVNPDTSGSAAYGSGISASIGSNADAIKYGGQGAAHTGGVIDSVVDRGLNAVSSYYGGK